MPTAHLSVPGSGSFSLDARSRIISCWTLSKIRVCVKSVNRFESCGSEILSRYENKWNLGRAVQYSIPCSSLVKCGVTGRNLNEGLPSYGDSYDEPFWLSLVKDILWSLRSLAIFLAEQPSQLKYIEWPTFKSTLKTAFLTLVLVVVLIVALSSVDATLSYILAWYLRKSA